MCPPTPASLWDRLRSQLAELKMPGALEALDNILRQVDSGQLAAGEAVGAVLGAQIRLPNQRRLQTAVRSARFPAVKTLGDFDFTFQPSVKREKLESFQTLGFLERKENVVHSESGRRTSRSAWRSPPPSRDVACTTSPWRI
jgi:DNA replication protein DnaC